MCGQWQEQPIISEKVRSASISFWRVSSEFHFHESYRIWKIIFPLFDDWMQAQSQPHGRYHEALPRSALPNSQLLLSTSRLQQGIQGLHNTLQARTNPRLDQI
jgi:hypothetical protein